MTQAEYDQAVNAWFLRNLGKRLNIDGAYGTQCKDVFSSFNKEVGKLPYIVGDAYPLWLSTTVSKYYTKIPNGLTFIPKRGDIAIWYPWRGNPYGHISVVSWANLLWFTSMDQNWPVQGYYDSSGHFIGTSSAHYVSHNYLSPKVVGFLRLKI